jgi:hypothetical protein
MRRAFREREHILDSDGGHHVDFGSVLIKASF